MINKQVKVINHDGIHARPSFEIIDEIEKFSDHEILVTNLNRTHKINGNVMNLLSLCIEKDHIIDISVSGHNEIEVCEIVSQLFVKDFNL